jgi:hypothetical protein
LTSQRGGRWHPQSGSGFGIGPTGNRPKLPPPARGCSSIPLPTRPTKYR